MRDDAKTSSHDAARAHNRFLGFRYGAIVFLLTIVAGILRFTALDKPAIWGDEAATWRRITGSYPELVQELRQAGFMPAHYLITWWIKDGFPYYGKFVETTDALRNDRRRFADPNDRQGGGPPGQGRQGQRPPQGQPPQAASPDVPVDVLDFEPTHRLVPGGITPTPFVMRFVPALCGTLMVPAMYFLASMLVARRTALLVAVFTCFSAYALGYSRDAKMYMQFWLFATLHVGCLLWWLAAYRRDAIVRRDPKFVPLTKQQELGAGVAGVLSSAHVGHIARAFITTADLRESTRVTPAARFEAPSRLATMVRWACWVTTGLAMIAFHAIGLAVVGIELVILLTTESQRLHAWTRLSRAIASPALLVVDLVRNRRKKAVNTDAAVVPLTPTVAAAIPSAFGMPTPPPRPSPRLDAASYSSGRRFWKNLFGFAVPPVFGFVLGALAIVALWSSYKDFTRFYNRVLPDATNASLEVDVNDAGIGWVEVYNQGRTAPSMFIFNFGAYLLNWEWVRPNNAAEVDPRALWWLTATTSTLLIAIVVGALPWRQMVAAYNGDHVRLREVGPMPFAACFIVAAWLLLPTYGLYVAGGAWANGGKVRAVSPVQAVAAIYQPVQEARFRETPPKNDRSLPGVLTRELRPAVVGERSWSESLTALRGAAWGDLFKVETKPLAKTQPWVPDSQQIASSILIAPLDRYAGSIAGPLALMAAGAVLVAVFVRVRSRRFIRWMFRGALVVVVLFALLLLIYLAVPMQKASVWMPRYAGFVWPAFVIGMCVLIRRLPLLPVRWGVITLLIGANLTNFVMRCRLGEPPTAAIAADMLADQNKPAVRFFGSSSMKQFGGGPGAGTVFSFPNTYYVATGSGMKLSPSQAMGAMNRTFNYPRFDGDSIMTGIRAAVRRSPEVNEFHAWIERRVNSEPDDATTKLRTQLGAEWELAEPVDRRTIYDHWTWRRNYVLERHHWRKAAVPATTTTSPATAPTPR